MVNIVINLISALLILGFSQKMVQPKAFTIKKPAVIAQKQPITTEKGRTKNGKKHGFWRYYNQEGKEERREKWKNGTLAYTIWFDKNHKKIKWQKANGEVKTIKNCDCK